MDLADQLKLDYQQHLVDQQRARVFESVADIVALLGKEDGLVPERISLSLLLIGKEPFHSGWNLWLTSKELSPVTAEMAKQILELDVGKKGRYAFRLSVWERKKRPAEGLDIETIPQGSEILVERVTGLILYQGKLAQGNATRLTVLKNEHPIMSITHADDSESDMSGDADRETEPEHEAHPTAASEKPPRKKKEKTRDSIASPVPKRAQKKQRT